MDSIYDILMSLPLFKGANRECMMQIVGSARLHFLKYPVYEVIVRAGDPCRGLSFIISGRLQLRIFNPDGLFSVTQTLNAPDVISPEFLFGKFTVWPATATAIGSVSMLHIDKADYLKILDTDPVFLFNYLNILSVCAQKSVEGILAVSTGSLPERIAFWISALTQPRSSDIVLECRQRDLTGLFGVSRTALRSALEEMKSHHLLDYTPSRITVHDRAALLALLHNHAE